MENIHQVFIKYHNVLVYRSSLKEKVPVNTRNTAPNTFNISFFVVPHLHQILNHDGTYQIETTRHPN